MRKFFLTSYECFTEGTSAKLTLLVSLCPSLTHHQGKKSD